VNPRVVAFDLSLTSTGVADRNGTRRICPKSTGVERLAEVRNAVIDAAWFEDSDGPYPADLVVIEGYSYASGNSAHQVGELGGVVRLALHEAGIRFEVVAPKTIKTYACDNGGASKDDVLLAAVRRLGYEGKSKDEADAYWLYALAMHALGEPIVDVPRAHLRALKALPWAVAVAA
jgi:crossover junction endodeoxyribonuclease RuvC